MGEDQRLVALGHLLQQFDQALQLAGSGPSSGCPEATSISGWLHTCFRWLSIASTAPRRPKRSPCASIRGSQWSTVARYRLACSTVSRQ
jgi:hypothetical protein